MNGYWSASTDIVDAKNADPSLVRASKLPSGASTGHWLVTSDVGYWDSGGNLWFCGRRTDSIRTGGETVLAGEVERVLALHPLIVDAAVFGLPDDKFGHTVACAIVAVPQMPPQEGGSRNPLTVTDIRSWCDQCGLAGYKRPRKMYHVDSIPKNSSGKALKYLLVERFSSQPASAASKTGRLSKL
jgi:acyl-CoA synthetase (AMP-forming)/AMP-acid ligase II